MLIRRSVFVVLLLLCAGWPAVAVGQTMPFPDPSHCSGSDRFVVCPAGDVRYDVIVRDQYWVPCPGIGVWVDFSGCAGLRLCPACCAGATIDPVARTAYAVTDALGAVSFSLGMGGVCNGSLVSVYLGSYPGSVTPGILLSRSAVSSTDQDGDLDVDATDVAAVAAAMGTVDWGADFNGDGIVSQGDLDWLTSHHVGHACVGVVGARTSSWGGLKLLYR